MPEVTASPSTPQRVVLVVGVFDLFHRGHLELLRKARQFGDKLVVGVNSDAFTAEYKRKPVFSEDDRLAIITSLRQVDVVELNHLHDLKPMIERHGVNIIVHGDDWDHEGYLRQNRLTEEYLAANKIEMIYTPYYKGVSTSQIIDQMKAPV